MKQGLGMLPAAADAEEETMDEELGALSAVADADAEEAVDAADAVDVEEEAGALPYAAVRTAMTARREAAKARQAYYDDLTAKLTAQRAGPSFSERMFQLSAALAQPTTRRGFGAVLANVAPVLQAQEQAKREGEIKRRDALSALQAAQLNQQEDLLGQELETEVELAKLTTPKPARMVGTQIVNGIPVAIMQDASGVVTTQPLGVGATATAAGGTKTSGTIETRGGVQGYYNERNVWTPLPQRQTQETFRDATPEEAAARNAVSGQISNLTGLFKPDAAPKPRTLSAPEQKILVQSEDVFNSATDTLGKLRRVMELNPKALEGSLTGFRKTVGSLFSSDDPTYVATEELDNTLSSMALGMLKSTFPGSVTEGERKALMALQGSSSLPRAARDRIFRNAFEAAQTVAARARDRITKTKEGYYTERTSPAKPAAGKPRVINWNN
jgi:hypothetical protein